MIDRNKRRFIFLCYNNTIFYFVSLQGWNLATTERCTLFILNAALYC